MKKNRIDYVIPEFAPRLEQAIRDKGMNKKEVSIRLGLHEGTVCAYTTDKIQPSISVLKDLCELLGVSADYLLEIRSEKMIDAESCEFHPTCGHCFPDNDGGIWCAGCERKFSKLSYWENVCHLQRKQTAKGVRTYGRTLEENTELSAAERLTMLEEELIDGLMYIEHIKAYIKSKGDDGK